MVIFLFDSLCFCSLYIESKESAVLKVKFLWNKKITIICIASNYTFIQIAFCVSPSKRFLKNHFHNCIFKTPALRILVALAITLQSLSVNYCWYPQWQWFFVVWESTPFEHLIKAMDSLSTSPPTPKKKHIYKNR